MSVIEFLCPNGHELKAKPELIGKPGKCPHCASKFVVPDPGDDESEEESDDETPAPQTPPAQKPKEETFVFLCPNGHQLSGPVSLQGKPGKCPHCDAKFRIPSDDDEEEEDEKEEPAPAPPVESSVTISPPQTPSVPEASVVDDDIPVGSIVDGVDPATAAGLSGVIEFPEAEIEVEEDDNMTLDSDPNMQPPGFITPTIEAMPTGDATPTVDASMDATIAPSGPLQHTLATTFLQLWSTRRDGDVVELHLRDGAVISPERFAKSLSRDAYAAFAEKTDDGSHTITLVAWDAIERISFRNMGGLPKDLFD